MVLQKIKNTAEEYLGESVNEAVITWVNTDQESMKSSKIPDNIKEKLNKYLIN